MNKQTKNIYNTTLIPSGPPPHYWAGSNQVNFRDRTRMGGALRLMWTYSQFRWGFVGLQTYVTTSTSMDK
jgi:hypothetical protein